MDYLMDEAKREMKRDGQSLLAKKIAPYAIGFATVSVIIAAGGLTARYYFRVTQENATYDYIKAMGEDKNTEKERLLREVAQQGATPFSYIANIRLLADNKLAETAGASYTPLPKPVASFAGAPVAADEAKQFSELAEFYVRLQKAKKTEAALALADDVAIAAANPQAIWSHSLKELHAFALLQAKDLQASGAIFVVLRDDENAPEGIRSRAKELAAVLMPNATSVGPESEFESE